MNVTTPGHAMNGIRRFAEVNFEEVSYCSLVT